MKFNLEFSNILIKHKGNEDDHRVYLKLWAVNKNDTSKKTAIGVDATVTKGVGYVRKGVCVTDGGAKVPTMYVIGLKNSQVTISMKYEGLNIPYANAKVQIQICTPDTAAN